MTNSEETIVREAYRELRTPDFDIRGAVARRLAAQTGTRRRPRLLVAAALMIALISAGALAGTQWIQWEVVRHNAGEIASRISGLGQTEAEAYLHAAAAGEVRIAGKWNDGRMGETSTRFGARAMADESSLQAAVRAGSLPFPVGMTEGYRFIEGRVSYYLDPKRPLSEPTHSDQRADGSFMETYGLPQGYESDLNGWNATYEDAAGHRFTIGATRNLSQQSVSLFSATQDAKVTQMQVAGYERSMVIEDPADSQRPLFACFARKVPPVEVMTLPDWIDWKVGAEKTLYTQSWDAVEVEIAGDLSREDALAIAQAMR